MRHCNPVDSTIDQIWNGLLMSSSERNSMVSLGCDIARKQAQKEREEYWAKKNAEAEAKRKSLPLEIIDYANLPF